MKNKDTQKWIPLYVDKWIFGSTRIELEPEERAVFIDLICLGAKDKGYIRANEEIGYLPKQLAGLLNITEELLNRTIQKCIKYNKLEDKGNGIYYLKNWDKYQFSNRTYRRYLDDEPENIIDENEFKEKIINEIKKYNNNIEINKNNKIDIFINTNRPIIINVKTNNFSDSIRGGIRQLLEYGIEYKDAILVLALPIYYKNEISGRWIKKLEEYNIKLLTLGNLDSEISELFRQMDTPVRQTDTIEYNIIKDNNIIEEKEKYTKEKEKEISSPNGDGCVVNDTKKQKHTYTEEFEIFWKAYPRKVGKGAAFRSWKAHKPDLNTCLKAIEIQKQTEQWKKSNGQFIPHPTTWINQHRWEDEVEVNTKYDNLVDIIVSNEEE